MAGADALVPQSERNLAAQERAPRLLSRPSPPAHVEAPVARATTAFSGIVLAGGSSVDGAAPAVVVGRTVTPGAVVATVATVGVVTGTTGTTGATEVVSSGATVVVTLVAVATAPLDSSSSTARAIPVIAMPATTRAARAPRPAARRGGTSRSRSFTAHDPRARGPVRDVHAAVTPGGRDTTSLP